MNGDKSISLEDIEDAPSLQEVHTALEDLLLLVERETGLPESAANGVMCPNAILDEGVVRAHEIIRYAYTTMTKLDLVLHPEDEDSILDESRKI